MGIRTVRFMRNQDAVDLYRCLDNGRVYARLIRTKAPHPLGETVCWATTSSWSGGYEPDAPMREGIELHIVDGVGNELFVEKVLPARYAVKKAPFSWEEEKRIARKWAESNHLITHEQWKEELLKTRNLLAPSMDLDNWCYFEVIVLDKNRTSGLDALGRKACVEIATMEHKISHQCWNVYMLKDDKDNNLEICGYEWITEN